MNVITEFFVHNIVAVYFFYGLAFFVMGLALLFAGRRTSQLRFALAILPLAAFGLLHAAHEWYEMFEKVAAIENGGLPPSLAQEVVRLLLLALSFAALLAFAFVLLTDARTPRWKIFAPIGAMLGLWLVAAALVAWRFALPAPEAIGVADSLARYGLGIPAAILGAWALMAQQHTFREHDMPQFGRDLVWAAAALLLYGAVGQIFVRETVVFPSHFFSSQHFLDWFGIPVQLFRALMAAALTWFLLRALRAFDLEEQRRLETANSARLQAQAAALEAERRTSRQMETLNDELRLAAHKLSLLLDLSNLLDAPLPLPERMSQALGRIVQSLPFSEAGMILLLDLPAGGQPNSLANGPGNGAAPAAHAKPVLPRIGAEAGFEALGGDCAPEFDASYALGLKSIRQGLPLCLHADEQVMEFQLEVPPAAHRCRQYLSPTRIIALPLTANHRVIGCLVLARCPAQDYHLSPEEPALMAGIAQQLGLSIDNALLQAQAQEREQLLGELLHQIVGAQEAERQRIARELHDATGQSLTAVGLGLRGVETWLAQAQPGDDPRVLIHPVKELRTFSQNALGELRNIISDLRPPQLDDLGLAAALRWYIQAYEQRRGIRVRFVAEGDDAVLPAEYRTVLFRVAQEALTNIAKHAAASEAAVTLAVGPERVQLDVRDNGKGFDAQLVSTLESESPAGWGLVGIRERALLLGGRADIETAPGAGTHLRVSVPLAAPALVSPVLTDAPSAVPAAGPPPAPQAEAGTPGPAQPDASSPATKAPPATHPEPAAQSAPAAHSEGN